MNKHINILSFNVPYPADYGGAIDVYYKLKALHDAGVEIILHTYLYDRAEAPELEKICKEVHYYSRQRGMKQQLSLRPYIVNSRTEQRLLDNLLLNPYPILFEGIHLCHYLDHPLLKERIKMVRMANIEHHYYYHLFKAERNLKNRLYYLIEALRLKLYQPILKNAQVIYGISTTETAYFARRFKGQTVEYLPCFHPNTAVNTKEGQGNYILYHANLSVAENEQAARWLIKHIFARLDFPAVIAGKNPSPHLQKLVGRYPHISLKANLEEQAMDNLIHNAQLHTLVTFQPTGLKLKLLNTLYQGRFCVANPQMTEGSGLNSLCVTATSPDEFLAACRRLLNEPFTEKLIEERRSALNSCYSNNESAKIIIKRL